MPAKDIERACGGLFRNAQQLHMYFLYFAPTLAVITVRTGGYNVCPDVLAAHMSRCHVVYRQIALALSTILAGIIIPAKDLTASQFDMWTRPMNLVLQPDD